MLKIIATLLMTALLVMLIGAGVVYSGVINVAADDPHGSLIHALLENTRERSIEVRAKDIEVPDLRNAELMRSGAGNYDAMCVGCHLAPGIAATELGQNLYPAPPDLTATDRQGNPAMDFWIIKHGIKSTGMPAWGKSMADPYIWGLVAFIDQLPSLTAMEYRTLVTSSDGHQHGGGETDVQGHSDARSDQSATGAESDHPHDSESTTDDHHPPEPAVKSNVHHHSDGSKHVH